MIELPAKFKQALGNGVRTSLYPIVRIYKDIQIDDPIEDATDIVNLSIKETNISGSAYKPLLLSSPSIKSSADIINNKYTISSVSLSISNAQFQGKIFSDDIQNLLNSVCRVYYAANGINELEDCLLVYTGTIRRFSQSAETIKLELEDLTEQKLKTKIPSTIIENNDLYAEEDIGKPYPMVYGYIDKSPLILNQQNYLEIDKPNTQIKDLWDAVSKVNFNNPDLTGWNHPLLRTNTPWLSEKASLLVYNDGYLPIMEQLGKNFGTRPNPTSEDTEVYTFENATTENSASIKINENVFLYEEYATDEETDEIYGKGNLGLPTRTYRPIKKVSFYAQNHSGLNLGNQTHLVSSCNKFFGFTGTQYNYFNNIAKNVTIETTSDNYAANDFSEFDEMYNTDWAEGGNYAFWKPTEINSNSTITGEFSATEDTNFSLANRDSSFPVQYIQNNDYDSGLHINSQNRYTGESGAYARFHLNEDIANYPCVTKILYNMIYYTPTNEIHGVEDEAEYGYMDLYYHPVCFWVEKQLLNDAAERNNDFEDMVTSWGSGKNDWEIYHDTENWKTECQVPNTEHSFEANVNNKTYTTGDDGELLQGVNYDNIILGFNNTDTYDSIQWGMPNISMNDFKAGSTMASLRNVYILQDCLITDIYNQDFFASVQGRTDNNNNVITKPQFILEDILRKELSFNGVVEYPDTEIQDNWINSFTLNEQSEAKNIINDLFKSSVYIPSFNSKGQFNFLHLLQSVDDVSIYPEINTEDILKYSFSLTKIEDVKNQVNIKYKKNYGSGNFDEETGYGIEDNDGIIYETLDNVVITGFEQYDINYYGIKSEDAKLEIESDYIRDKQTARKLQRKLLMWYANQHLITKIDLPVSYMHLEVGDYIRLDQLIGGKLAFGYDYTDTFVKNGQVIYPLFFINKASKSVNKISIEAVQVHRGDFGLTNDGLGQLQIPDPYSDEIYEEEVEQEYYFNVNWLSGNNLNQGLINAFVDTNQVGDIDYTIWIRSINETFHHDEISWNFYEWEIGEQDALDLFFNSEIIQDAEGYGGKINIYNLIEAIEPLNLRVDFTLEIRSTDSEITEYKDFYYTANQGVMGDVTGDNVLNVLDIVAIVQHTLGNTQLNENQIIAADSNGDGIINVLDIVYLIGQILEE